MLPAPIPRNEAERLADLRALEILDTPPEERFDRLVRLASHLFGVPIAYIALVDAKRQWFKASCGVEVKETGRDVSFCGHAIVQRDTFVVPDAQIDDRFRDNPLVQGEPHIRFYAGHPLPGRNGHNVGTFCLADRHPRKLDGQELETLKQLASLAAHELNMLELIHTQRQLIHTREQLARELAEAAQYVKALLPAPITDGPVRTSYRFISSSQLGGDLLGYHWLNDDKLAFFIIDVCGHGVGPALLSAAVYSALRREALANTRFDQPKEVLVALNRAFPMDEHDDKFFTILYGVYDRTDRRMTYASAGHPPGLLVSPGGDVARVSTSDFMIGVMPVASYKTKTMTIAPGSRLYLYSDGVYETSTPDGAQIGMEGLEHVVRRQAGREGDRTQAILDRIRELHGEAEFEDDFSLLEIEFA